MKHHKAWVTALAVTGLGSIVLALILAFTVHGTGDGIDFRNHFLSMHGRFAQEQQFANGDAADSAAESRPYGTFDGLPFYRLHHGMNGRGYSHGLFLFVFVGLGIFFLVHRRNHAGMVIDPLSELSELYSQGSISREEFLKRKTVLEGIKK